MPNLPTLTPITSPWMHELMEQKTVLNELLEKYGSPINIHQCDAMAVNLNSYQKVFEEYGLKYKVFFARKANKTKGVVQKSHELGIGIDTASFQEYNQCLQMGISPSDLIVTAAVKNRKLIEKAVENGSLLILDNEDECDLVQQVAIELNRVAQIGFRLSGFFIKERKLNSRFGFDLLTIDNFLTENFLNSQRYHRLDYKGLHFHLNGYSVEERGYALAQCLAFSKLIAKKGFKTEFIDIGGGLLMNYLKYESEWDLFNHQLRKSISNKISPITYDNQGLGLQVFAGVIHGQLNTYPFWTTEYKGEFLRKILMHQTATNPQVAATAKELDIEIRMEPGRSMLDQVGVTIAKVANRKQADGDWLIGLEMNMTQMLSGSADFLLDPSLISQEPESQEDTPAEVYFTGAYCLERDVLLKRKIALSKLPKVGDLVMFVNTAGYMMHFFESSAHLFPLATNLIWNRTIENGKIDSSHFQNDENL